jgi:heptosyltransferase-2
VIATLFYTLLSPRQLARWFPLPARAGLPLADCRSILVIKPDLIGDFVLCTPFLRELRRNAPKARIELVVRPAVLNLAERCPHVDQVRSFEMIEAKVPVARSKALWRSWRFARTHWRRRDFDLGILPRWDFDIWHAAYLLYASRAARRASYSERVTAIKSSCNRDMDMLLTDAVTVAGPVKHEVHRSLDLLAALGGRVEDTSLEVWTAADDEFPVTKLLAEHGVPAGVPMMALAPAVWESKKKWPEDRYVDLCRHVLAKWCGHILILGGAADSELTARIARRVGPAAFDAGGRLTLRQTVCALRRCALYVGNDTGVKHLAAAVKLPVVEICGYPDGADPSHPLSPARFGAFGTRGIVVQPLAGSVMPAIAQITVSEVGRAIGEILA